ncbi:MAG: RpiB/LacA/LacB family sugar-phosphate isomerase [Candidatus Omnitrophica bacterium]|nr:RpiB/LacA/LacB family sugar-phosphate isomerase [Candidatus Omnitrophota bacterium]
MAKKIALGADHGGFLLKEKVKKFLLANNYKVVDAGTFSDAPCDYPEFGYSAAEFVSKKKAWRAIVVCKSGIGMSIVANKLSGVRAGLCTSVDDAASAREHNDTNVLVLSAKKTNIREALKIVEKWLMTEALPGRHARRVRAIKKIEKKVFR